MDNLHLSHELEKTLRAEDKYCMGDGTLIKSKIVEDALNLNPGLLKHLLSHEELKKNFFSKVDRVLVFDKVKFQHFVMNKSFLPDSYTAYKNKIGLTDGEEHFIGMNQEVVLSWPHKDCVLEGGQTKEDAKRDEIFWNEILAPDAINRLTEPKALAGFKRCDKDGEHDVGRLKETDNLVIKGNNLLSLYSLRKKYAGKVKLIYIDPPYYFAANKPEDTFNYNANFKRSTWCTFMKNRLEVARELLSDDGAIFAQINDDGVGELHLLMKEVFNKDGENNFINKITVKTRSPSGFASVNPGVFESAEYILAFAKHKPRWKFKRLYVKSEYDDSYSFCITNPNSPCSKWIFDKVETEVAKEQGYPDKKSALKKMSKYVFSQLVGEFALKNKERVFRFTAINDDAGADSVALREKSRRSLNGIFALERPGNYTLYVTKGQEIAFYSKKVREIDGVSTPSMLLTNIWTDISYEGIASEGGVKLKGGKKPERLIRRIVDMASNPGDLVLDFFGGSGTTAAVAYKLGRRFITCEQLDSQIDMSLKRLKAVAQGEQSGVSKIVDWKGGGSFVYCELAQSNSKFVELIRAATELKTLKSIWLRMRDSGYLNYKVDPAKIDAKAPDFETLGFEDQKRFLIECLDKNLLYVPLSDIDNEEYAISDEDKRLTREFYREN